MSDGFADEFSAFHRMMRGDNAAPVVFRLATIPASYVANSGRPTVTFDGETTATVKRYPYLASYTPAANDRVLIAVVGNGFVIIGKVV